MANYSQHATYTLREDPPRHHDAQHRAVAAIAVLILPVTQGGSSSSSLSTAPCRGCHCLVHIAGHSGRTFLAITTHGTVPWLPLPCTYYRSLWKDYPRHYNARNAAITVHLLQYSIVFSLAPSVIAVVELRLLSMSRHGRRSTWSCDCLCMGIVMEEWEQVASHLICIEKVA